MKIRLTFLTLALLTATAAQAGILEAPKGLTLRFLDGQPLLAWDPVDEAVLYRVAVFGPRESDGSKPLQAAVWVDATRWHYGVDATVARAGKLRSTLPKKLESGKVYSWMVSAARADGSDKGKWTGDQFVMPAAGPLPAPVPKKTVVKASFTPTAPLIKTATPTPTPQTDEFTMEPDEAEKSRESLTTIDFSVETEDSVEPSMDRARALLYDRQWAAAVAEFNKILADDPMNADAWEGLGDAYKNQRLKLEAVEAYEKCLEIDPGRKHLEQWIQKQRRF